jgi:hypothetical protein
MKTISTHIPQCCPVYNWIIAQLNNCTMGHPYPHPIGVETMEWKYTADEIMVKYNTTI